MSLRKEVARLRAAVPAPEPRARGAARRLRNPEEKIALLREENARLKKELRSAKGLEGRIKFLDRELDNHRTWLRGSHDHIERLKARHRDDIDRLKAERDWMRAAFLRTADERNRTIASLRQATRPTSRSGPEPGGRAGNVRSCGCASGTIGGGRQPEFPDPALDPPSPTSARTSSPSSAAACPRTGRSATAPPPSSSRPSSRHRASPAPSTEPPAGPMSEPRRGAGATTATSSTTSQKKVVWLRPLRRDWKRTLNR